MNQSERDRLQTKLLALQKTFIKSLPAKILDIKQQWEKIKHHEAQGEINHLHRLLHNLKGTTATYGHEDLARSLGTLEETIKSFQQPFPTPNEIKKTEALLNNLNHELTALNLPPKPSTLSTSLSIEKKPKLIYLLDSDKTFTYWISQELKPFQYQVKSFAKLTTLVDAFKQHVPFACITDISFLRQTEAKHTLRQLQKSHPHLMLITTQHSHFEEHLAAIRAGCHYYFNKSFCIEELIDKFDHYTQYAQIKYKVLIIEDSMEVAEYYCTLLEASGMNVYILTQPKAINKTLIEYAPDLILMDIYMPGCNGLELTTMIRQQEKYTSIPIIFLSAEEDRKKQLKAMSLGVDDFIAKSTKSELVILAIKNCAERYRLLTSLIKKDQLTGVFNHSTIQERLRETLKTAARLNISVAVAMIDLDNFKSINDRYGHIKGDQVLKNLCLLLRKHLRETDLIGRYGGEEFLILFPNTTAQQAKDVLDRIREKFAHLTYFHQDNRFHVTFSAGVSEYPQIKNKDKLIQYADKLLYEAKKLGKNKTL